MDQESSLAPNCPAQASTTSHSSPASFFPPRSQIEVKGGTMVQNVVKGGTVVNNINPDADKTKVLYPLYDKVSPNAILNAGGRADAVRCYPGTREEVIALTERWINADHSAGHQIFWLSGPAGAGKSAIVQTIAERCIKDQVAMVNFFFFRADPTRNHSQSLVATLLHQLFDLFPDLKEHVIAVAIENPVIFRQSMKDQFSALIEQPLRQIQEISRQRPPVVLIDGLDECGPEPGKAEQSALLDILHEMAVKANPVFTVLVASRTEAHLTTTFNEIGYSSHSIYLDESYRPRADIQRFLFEEFSKVKKTHNLRRTLDKNWPPEEDVRSIADKSSGHFVYASTVIRFIQTSAASPKHSLEIVLGLRPITRTSPFSTLDALYTHILSQAEDWQSVRDILVAQKLAFETRRSLTGILFPLRYTEDDILSHLSDLTSVIKFQPGGTSLTIFHASLDDFLYTESRAGSFYIDMDVSVRRIAIPHCEQATSLESFAFCPRLLERIAESDEALDKFLEVYLPKPEIFKNERKWQCNGVIADWLSILTKLYQVKNPQLHRTITSKWQALILILTNVQNTSKNSHALAQVKYDSMGTNINPIMGLAVFGKKMIHKLLHPGRGVAKQKKNLIEGTYIIPVLGTSGVGKSTFINQLVGREVAKTGTDLINCTSKLQPVEIPASLINQYLPLWNPVSRNTDRLIIVDTPSFDWGGVDFQEILQLVADWLAKSYGAAARLTGIIHLLDISMRMIPPSPQVNFLVLDRLCGANACESVVLGTTHWERSQDIELATWFEADLELKYWREMIRNRSIVHRVDDKSTRSSPWTLVAAVLFKDENL